MNKYGLIKNKYIVARYSSYSQAVNALKYRESIEGENKSGKLIKLNDSNRKPAKGIRLTNKVNADLPF